MFGLLSDTWISSMRPPMLAGPIDRKRKLARRGFDDWLMAAESRRGCCAASEDRAATPAAASTMRVRMRSTVSSGSAVRQTAALYRLESKGLVKGERRRFADALDLVLLTEG